MTHGSGGRRRVAICADVGSTYTKVAVVDLDGGELVATAEHPTTVDTDVLHGLDAAIRQATPGARTPEGVFVCSSAGGGLRLAVVGYERLVTAEAGHRVGLTAGARVVHVAAGPLERDGMDALRTARPDVVLLVGGTDGGEADVLRHNANRLARLRPRVPVVLAGNAEVRDEVAALLGAHGTPVVATGNVLPRIGVLNPRPARQAIREVFLRHVIGGKKLSRGPRFARLVRAATPDAVLSGVELLAETLDGDLLVVDVGGATTDVYSFVRPGDDDNADVAGHLGLSRTVEGDLGVRWGAAGVVAAATAERLLDAEGQRRLEGGAQDRTANPAMVASTDSDHFLDAWLAGLAAVVAVRRHARADASAAAGRGRRDLRQVRLVVGSGGVLRHVPSAASTVLDAVLTDHGGGWAPPDAAGRAVDSDYILAAAGLLATEHRDAAQALLRKHILDASEHAGTTRRSDQRIMPGAC